MTGFGKANISISRKKFSVEVRSVNSKGLDANFRLPGIYREKETELKNLLSEKLLVAFEKSQKPSYLCAEKETVGHL